MGKNRDNVNKRKWGKQGQCEQKEMGKIGAMRIKGIWGKQGQCEQKEMGKIGAM